MGGNTFGDPFDAQIGSADIEDGSISSIKLADTLQSDNYVAGVSGWIIRRDTGDVEFGAGSFRGDLVTSGQVLANGPFGFSAALSGGQVTVARTGGFTRTEGTYFRASCVDSNNVSRLRAGELSVPTAGVPGTRYGLEVIDGAANVVAALTTDRFLAPITAGRIVRQVAQSIPPAGAQIGALVVDFLTNGMATTGGQNLVVPVTGIYQVDACVHYGPTGAAAPWWQCIVAVNGAPARYGAQGSGAGTYPGPAVSDLIALNAGDVLGLFTDHGAGVAINTRVLGDACYLSAALVREAP